MSKIVRRMNREDPIDRHMNSGMSKRELAHMRAKHLRWPLSTEVLANTPAGVLPGKVFKHWRRGEVAHGCSILFPICVDMGDANGSRFAHNIPFRNLFKV